VCLKKQAATVIIATARIAVATQIILSYSPGGANGHPSQTYGSLSGANASLSPERHFDRFSRFAGLTNVFNGHITDHVMSRRLKQ